MERDAARLERRLGARGQSWRYGLAAAAIWMAVAYGLGAPPTARPARFAAAVGGCEAPSPK